MSYPKPQSWDDVIYISGPMSGCEDYNFPAFNKAEDGLVDAGWGFIENPASQGIIPGWDWSDYLRFDIKQIADCDAIYMMNGWADSKGARLEHHVAKEIGMKVYYESEGQ